jgi:hypothetical protein
MSKVYTMHIEKPAGTIAQHGFRLGTDLKVAEDIVLERLRTDPDIVTIALRVGHELVRIYDFRDHKPDMLTWAHNNRAELVAFIGQLFTEAEIRDAKLRLPKRPANAALWGIFNDAELGDCIDWANLQNS